MMKIYPCFTILKEDHHTTYARVKKIKQNKFMLSVTEANHVYDRDVKVSFETFYDVIFVSMVTKTLLRHTSQKSIF